MPLKITKGIVEGRTVTVTCGVVVHRDLAGNCTATFTRYWIDSRIVSEEQAEETIRAIAEAHPNERKVPL